MGCPSEVVLGRNLTFSITTHDPDTGVLTDADSAPAYRIYEDETGAAILNGTMTILDNANTTGFYTEQVACTAANGFEHEKCYTVYITATVGGDQGGISYGFRAVTDVWSRSTRTLTSTAASTLAAVEGSTVTQPRTASWSFSLTGIGSVADRTSLYFTLKRNRTMGDSQALVQIEETGGLLYINAAAATVAGNGTLTVTDAAAGNVTITLADDETANLEAEGALYYDIKKITATGSQIMTEGRFNISNVVTESIT